MLGWETSVSKGNKVSLDTTSSPVLNYNNSEAERRIVIGDKSLNSSDKVAFERKVSQVVISSPYVKLLDGLYTLTATIKSTDGFSKLEMYAESAGKRKAHQLIRANPQWVTIELQRVPVKNGKVEIGIWAAGKANASCQVEDI